MDVFVDSNPEESYQIVIDVEPICLKCAKSREHLHRYYPKCGTLLMHSDFTTE